MSDRGEPRDIETRSINPQVAAAVEHFVSSSRDSDAGKFATTVREASAHERFPKAFFDEEHIALEYRDLHVDQIFLQGMYDGMHEEADAEEKTCTTLINAIKDAINAKTDEVNVAQCREDTKLIGYLLGRKLALHDKNHVPPGFGEYHTLALRALNHVAMSAYDAFAA